MIVSKFKEISEIGYPRSPSFPPNSKIRVLGLCLLSILSILTAPPFDVSPDTLALIIVTSSVLSANRLRRILTHPFELSIPYAALILSPYTTIVLFWDDAWYGTLNIKRKKVIRKIIEAKGLEKTVQLNEHELTILKGINLDINYSESFAILGTSGSGKTTLLSLLAGLDLPTKGEIWINGSEITRLSEEQRANLRLNHVSFVFQGFQLLANLTALENVMLPSELRGDKDAEDKALKLLDRVELSNRVHHQPNQLSGGEQQRVAIARAFASSADILFADEPTGNLDSATGGRVIDIMFELNRELGTTLVLVTHDQMLSKYCDRSLRLESGIAL